MLDELKNKKYKVLNNGHFEIRFESIFCNLYELEIINCSERTIVAKLMCANDNIFDEFKTNFAINDARLIYNDGEINIPRMKSSIIIKENRHDYIIGFSVLDMHLPIERFTKYLDMNT